ncbi:SDR family NAD(P)-dependent oxidoreductase [Bosea sp. MMO-172]|uniref:SDR family NAD(P)-dependent oxidoreductase n=1 Tax=Bosea sp. MMO-172 TaxID=3127885 RepID=UPI0030178236
MRLGGKLAIITAAASGMGRAGCKLFAENGATVAAIDIDRERLEQVVAEIKAAGGRAIALQADLSSPEACKDVMKAAIAELGGLDVLWAHAGIPGPAAVEDVDLAEYRRAIDLNITSALICAGEAAPAMRARNGGAIVFTASVSGLVGSPASPVYSAAKFGVVGLAKSLAQRFAPDGIRVNAVCPGLTETPMKAVFLGRSDDDEGRESLERRVMASIPLGRVARPEEIAHGALWLASDDASYVTGVALPVDGGYTSR